MSDEQWDYEKLRKRVEKRYNHRVEFYSHAVVFFVVNGPMWGLWWITAASARISAIPLLIITLGWMIGLVIHAVMFWGQEATERAIEREIEKEREWRLALTSSDKRKRSATHLSEDGELLDDADYEFEEDERHLRRG